MNFKNSKKFSNTFLILLFLAICLFLKLMCKFVQNSFDKLKASFLIAKSKINISRVFMKKQYYVMFNTFIYKVAFLNFSLKKLININ